MRRCWLLVMLMACLPAPASAAAAIATRPYTWQDGVFAVPLEVRDNSGVERINWPVTSGVPLPVGVVKDPTELRLTDADGNEIPAQFTVLSRYGGRDNSVRWVLLDFQITLAANGRSVVYLRNDHPARPIEQPIHVVEEVDRIRVRTGALAAAIPKLDGALLHEITLHGETLLRAQPGDGPRLRAGEAKLAEHSYGPAWNTHGWNKSRSLEKVNIAEADYVANRPRTVTVETNGPLRTVIQIRDRHAPISPGPGILKDGLYYYTVRLHFFRNKNFVLVQYDIENSGRKQPQWNHLFREASLRHTLALGGKVRITGGGRIPGDNLPPAASFPLAPGQAGWLYQTSGQTRKKGGRTQAVEGGYRVGISGDGHIATPAAAGRRGRFLDVSNEHRGVAVAMRYLWEQAPRAIALSGERMEILVHADSPGRGAAGKKRPEYQLDFGERNIHDVLYYFHAGSADQARVADVAEAFEYPLFAYASPAWYSDTETWYFEVAPTPGNAERDSDSDRHWDPDRVGVRGHGYNGGYNSGGHHESLNSGWLSFLRSGKLADFERNTALSRWAIAHNPGWVYENNVLGFGKGKERYRDLDRELLDWDRLTAFGPKDYYLWKTDETYTVKNRRGTNVYNRGGSTYLDRYKHLPDHAHYALFRLFEYYYLTGDPRTLDSIHGFVDWAINFQNKHLFQRKTRPLSDTTYFERDPAALGRGHRRSRVYTWMLYTTLAGFHATASPVFDEYARWQIRRMLGLLRQRHGQLSPPANAGERDPQTGARIYFSKDQTWMEGQGVLALHEAYKTYGDERILDGLWGLADYFTHHVPYFPRLGLFSKWTAMPNQWLGHGQGKSSLDLLRHARHIQALPLIYHYTGWPESEERYRSIEAARQGTWVRDWFLQTGHWEQNTAAKRSNVPPERITDLRVVDADRDGITLRWTSPRDDGPAGRAAQYFVKYSAKPIVEFAPTDNPARAPEKQRVIQEVENLVLSRPKRHRRQPRIKQGEIQPEAGAGRRWHPDWHKVNAFWMAEHVAGEPRPGVAGQPETFTVRRLRPHNWFGTKTDPGLEILPAGAYYLAICSWDEDKNLSRLSNVVRVDLR